MSGNDVKQRLKDLETDVAYIMTILEREGFIDAQTS